MALLVDISLNPNTDMKKIPLERRNTVDGLLSEIHVGLNRRYSCCCDSDTGNSSAGELSYLTSCLPDVVQRTSYTKQSLLVKDTEELNRIETFFNTHISRLNYVLLLQLKIRDRILRRRDFKFDIITATLQAMSPKRRVDTKMKFSVDPLPGDSGFSQWCGAMQMVSRLPGGIPIEFRKRLWLTLADKHVQSKKTDWNKTKFWCLNEKMNPDDDKLGVQIVKDLHRTGCSMFSGEETEHNQALLKKVLLAYARWNKVVGYCQGFNMLAAIILEVMDWNEENALKVMIYLIEEVLPEGYFANHMRGLSVDMAVFRELLKMRFPVLSQHLDRLQYQAQDSGAGTSYEPPLTNVFTMQWFLTLFSNCLPKSTVLRVWDLIFLEGNEVLLRTALSIWGGLADRVLTVESADEFYSIMGVLTREMLEFGIMDANDLVKTICSMTPLSPSELNDMRDKYAYNIRPLTSTPFSSFKKNLKLLYSDDEDECDDDNLAMATWCLSNTMQIPKSKGPMGFGDISPGAVSHNFSGNHPTPSANNVDAERMSLDISALKKQYAKLRERQKQAHVILTGAFTNNTFSRQRLPVAVNHLLVGKKPLVRKNKPTSKITFEFKSPTKPMETPSQFATERKKPTVQITKETGKTLSWAEVKKERLKVRTQSSNNIEEEERRNVVPRDISESSSCSSSSTELCDNDLDEDDEDDFGASLASAFLEEPLTGVKASSSYEADEDSISESVDSSTLVASESAALNIQSPGSNSTLGEDPLVSSSNSIRFDESTGLSSYLGNYRRSQDISPLSKSPDSDGETKFDPKTYLANYKMSSEACLSPDLITPDDEKLNSASFMFKYGSDKVSPADDDDNDENLDTMAFLAKYKIPHKMNSINKSPIEENTPFSSYTNIKPTEDVSPISKSPELEEKFDFSKYLAKYKLSMDENDSESKEDKDATTSSFSFLASYEKTTEINRSIEKSTENETAVDTETFTSKYLSSVSSLDSTAEVKECNPSATSYSRPYSWDSSKFAEIEQKYGLSRYLKDNTENEPIAKSPEKITGESSNSEKQCKISSPVSPENGDSSSPYDSSPELNSPELETSSQQSSTPFISDSNKAYNNRKPAGNGSNNTEEATDKIDSSNETPSQSFNPFPTVKKIGYIANATAKLGLYTEKEYGLKENSRNNSLKPKFQFPKTLK